ncbi:H-2 class I histocompatibility antigen, Q9 alpha chain-like isoform X1 [Scyliorhinus canicula]|uniref:H-2 class I histocompatibility antigen, Q9 alpha chain-like isoform X1 n=1 Tax=Scyliorhinus canicula TaxID=7830 RepID=UPI0018F748D0|nr:H-2 class I histocompatibility antigen, Q9 alpha chain-like isoform X1 [Scyliorhinus canicula]XP_038672230.1 H-2 class I histocompatibility antigen, Q9 alpha chain-like isoform X1 [Scyliorhinus canicula]
MLRLILLIITGGVSAVPHSWLVMYTAITGVPELPEFFVVAHVDGVEVHYYDSHEKKLLPRQRWMEESEGPDYWERQQRILRSAEQVQKTNIKTAMERTNQTSGIHVLQVLYGCELGEDSSVRGFHQHGWDGRDSIGFDTESMVWVAAVPWTLVTKIKWDRDPGFNQGKKRYLEGTCVQWLKTYLEQGKRKLKPVPPQVFINVDKATDTNPDQLSCLVTGFYPGQIEVTLLRNGEPITDTFSTGVLPNHNDSYQLRRWSQINPEDGATYSCQFEQGEKGAETRDWDGTFRGTPRSPEGTNLGLIIGIVVAVGALIAVAIGVAMWKEKGGKNRAGYSSGIAIEKEKSSSNSSVQA